jgi:hypothetical protein
MAIPVYYRYVSSADEMEYIFTTRTIMSNSGVTYFTPNRYEDAGEAQRKLNMPSLPLYRVGPTSADMMPGFDIVDLQPVPGALGDAVEAATSRPVYLFGIYDFRSGLYVN